MIDFLEHAANHLAEIGGLGRAGQPDLTDAPQGRQRRSELVSGIGREGTQLLERALEAPEHLVEGGGEPAQLVVGLDLDPVAQPLRRDPARLHGHAGHGRQGPAGQPEATQDSDGHTDGQTDQLDEQNAIEQLAHRLLRPRHADDDARATDLVGFLEQPHRPPVGERHRHVAARLPLEIRQPRSVARAVLEFSCRRPHLRQPPFVVVVALGPGIGPGPVEIFLDRLEVLVQAIVEIRGDAFRDEDVDDGREHQERRGQRGRVPEAEPRTDLHGSSTCNTNPTPRTV